MAVKKKFQLSYVINQTKWQALADMFGIRILITSSPDWNTEEIITAYHSHSFIEQELKNPIRVHYFICVLGYLLATLLWNQAR